MTKSTITREESVQAVFDLKVGYRLGFADLEILKRVARMALAAMDSSESVELPLDYLQGHKDGLEWASQLAEANHPETGDWLYDDPIELAKAIRKGPDMPPAQPAPEYPEALPCPVLLEPGLRFGKGIKTSTMLAALARRAVYESDMAALSPEERAEFQAQIEDFKSLIAQPVPDERDKAVDADDHPLLWSFNEGWNACRAAMLHAQSDDDGEPTDDERIMTIEGIHNCERCGDEGWVVGEMGITRCACGRAGNSPANPGCWCRTCRPVDINDMRFVVCPDCGNKRCPRENDHRNACTGSNEPGQEGSAYPDTQQEGK
ncbi:hypothetical protein [Klebsiella variicola]|uniref:hypothetical protein n=1 Tax=Klebsiella variicola TaxID=244366 RepID=UPI0007CC6408|nr:hypothetical protein [Klebsiella variicola]SAU27620.1 Uncharacterised protein [Klebsiella variicola]